MWGFNKSAPSSSSTTTRNAVPPVNIPSSFSVLQPTLVNGNSNASKSSTLETKIGTLPINLHANVLFYLPIGDVPRYAQTCRALAQLVKSDDRSWRYRCQTLGISEMHQEDPINVESRGGAGHHRGQSSISSLKSITTPRTVQGTFGDQQKTQRSRASSGAFEFTEPAQAQDDFGDFSETITSHTTGIPKLQKPPGTQPARGGTIQNLMDLDGDDAAFDDFDFSSVPLPSNTKSIKPSETKKPNGAQSGFFALPIPSPAKSTANRHRITSVSRRPTSVWYEAFKEIHLKLVPYVRILRTSSSAPSTSAAASSSNSSHLTPTQTLNLLFPPAHSSDSTVPTSLPLLEQAKTLALLVLYLTPVIEPTSDWAWIRRVLIGGGGVIDRWDGNCLNAFENLERRLDATSKTIGTGNRDADKVILEMRSVAESSWAVHAALHRSKILSSPPARIKPKSQAQNGLSFTSGLGRWAGLSVGGAADDADESWELGRVWVEKREVFYESGAGGKWDSGENIVKLPNAKGLPATHTLDFTPMSAVFMERMITRIKEDGGEALRIFGTSSGIDEQGGAGVSVVRRFVDRLVGEVIGEYVSSLLSQTRLLSQDLFLTASAATFVQVWRVVEVTKNVVLETLQNNDDALAKGPDHITTIANNAGLAAEKAVYGAFEEHMDEYLDDEIEWIKNVLDKLCKAWDAKQSGNTPSPTGNQTATFLSSSNPDQVKRNVLAGFRDALLLPVTIVPLTVSYGMNAIVTGGTQAVNGLAMLNPQRWTGQGGTDGREAASGAPIAVTDGSSEKAIPTQQLDKVEIEEDLESAEQREKADGEKMQLLLSLDTVLEFVHADRESLKRIETFQGYPGKYGRKVREAIEEVFIYLLRAVAGRHIVPACNKAIQQMTDYKPADSVEGTSNPPLLQYLELVNVVDTVTSILQVYFDKDLAKYIDKTDFLNAAIQEKKRFEGALDDAVASGMNAGVEVLMNQVEHIIQTRTQPGEYCPPPGQDQELGPTKACTDAITCLEVHCKLLKGSTSKEVLEVFYQEVGLRLQNILQKHIKRQIISLEGGFQMISDLNVYYAFITSLKQPRMAEEFSNLKMLGQVYIVADAKDLAQIIRDVTRYGGTYTPEDLYEFIQRRSDWKKIEKTVDKAMYALSVKEDCIIM